MMVAVESDPKRKENKRRSNRWVTSFQDGNTGIESSSFQKKDSLRQNTEKSPI